MASQPQPAPHANRLAGEKSPYLQQHAHNPVDWYPWGSEAFEAAKKQDKPIFLSIGYSTCHWCHVMERESFENPEIATLLNDVFINIKVDREELPQVDSIYMEFAQALMASGGGWPLNVILTPDLKPFFAVTYLPPKSKHGLIGLDQFTMQIKQLWQSEERMLLLEQANKLVETYSHVIGQKGKELPTEEDLFVGIEILFELADPVYGGIKGQPKFPMSYQLELLLQHSKLKDDSRALFYVELTLDMMQRGGLYDHVGGGFCRYTVDEKWIIPHFEKMTYDNALLAKTYLEAWKYTKRPLFRTVVEETLDYLMREVMHPDGGFYAGLDADSDGREGVFYTWTPEEIFQTLSPEDSELFCQLFGMSAVGNFEGKNVLYLPATLEEFAQSKKIPPEALSKWLKEAKEKLLKVRAKRKAPFRDQKILACWNGLAIDALARAGSALKRSDYTEAALKAARFIKTQLWKEGKLLRRWCDGEAKFLGVIEDYAFMMKACITLFEEGLGAEWLAWAIDLADVLETRFKDTGGAFFQSEEEILVRKAEFYDGAEPSGNGVHCENLLRLFQLTHEVSYYTQAEDILKAVRAYMEAYPPGACYLLKALQRHLNPKAPTLVVALNEKRDLENEIKGWLGSHFCPDLEVIWKTNSELDVLLPEEKEKAALDGKTAVFICRQNVCLPPLVDKKQIEEAIVSL